MVKSIASCWVNVEEICPIGVAELDTLLRRT